MTEDEHDEVHEIYEEISAAIDLIVKVRTAGSSQEVRDNIKERLQEQFRFW